jgi:RNA polymerase sigma-70 factor (ECF subfamily)
MTTGESQRRVQWVRDTMERHETPLLRYAWRILGDVERARDVVQETFLRMVESRSPGQDDRLRAWLFAVCRNRCLDVRRKERRMQTTSDHLDHTADARGDGPPAVAIQREAAERVERALADLPSNQQDVLRLKFQNGFSYKEIADITGLSASNVGFLIHTGVKTLRKQFKASGLLARA